MSATSACAGAPLAATSQLSAHWGNILAVLDGLLATLRANPCPAFLVRKLFQQLFSFVNVQARPASWQTTLLRMHKACALKH